MTPASVVCVASSKLSLEAFVDGPGPKDQQIVVRLHTACDLGDESLQVLEAVRLAGGPRDTAAAMTKDGIMPDVAGGPVVRRHP